MNKRHNEARRVKGRFAWQNHYSFKFPNFPLFTDFQEETGSLVILIFTLFLLLLTASFAIIDVSDTFLAKRELIEIGEVAITRAAHQISLSRYYAGNIVMDSTASDGAQFRIPLDCQAAFTAFQAEVSASLLRNEQISISNWSCLDDEVTGTLTASIPLLIKIPFGIDAGQRTITSTVAATSIIGGSRG